MALKNKLQPLIEGVPEIPESRRQLLISLWPTFAAITAAAVWIHQSYVNNKFQSEFPDFQFQAYLFICLGLVGVVVNLNVGWKNQNAKFFWACVDVVWITTALLSLMTMLGPVEQQAMKWRAEEEAAKVVYEQNRILNEVAGGVKIACTQAKSSTHCSQWMRLQSELTGKKSTIEWLERARISLPMVQSTASTKNNLDNIIKARERLIKSQEYESRARAIVDRFDPSLPYVNVVVLTIALGLRAGKSGADLAKGWSELRVWLPIKAWAKWAVSLFGKGWVERWESRPTRKIKAPILKSVSSLQSGETEKKTYVRESEINFVFQVDDAKHRVINLGSSSSEHNEINVVDSLQRLGDEFQSLIMAQCVAHVDSYAGNVLINLNRVIAIEAKANYFVLHFSNGINLHVVECPTRDENA